MYHKRFNHLLLGAAVLLATPLLAQAGPESLEGKKVAVLIGPGFHDAETLAPAFHLRQLGAEVLILGTSKEKLQAYNSEVMIPIQTALADVDADEFDALILPGGRGPGELRKDRNVIRFVRAFAETGRPIAAICHGPQVLATAGVIDGVSTTCFPGIADEMREHGASYVDREVEIDGQFITSRLPKDIPAFNAAIATAMASPPSNR